MSSESNARRLARQRAYDAAQRTLARSEGRCVACRRPANGASRCEKCAARRCEIRYFPIDEELSEMGNRILRALRFFDWVASPDLIEAMNISAEERPAYSSSLARIIARGYVEEIWLSLKYPRGRQRERQVRITTAGRERFQKVLRRYDVEVKQVAA